MYPQGSANITFFQKPKRFNTSRPSLPATHGQALPSPKGRHWIVAIAALLLCGCAHRNFQGLTEPVQPLASVANLMAGTAVFGSPVAADASPTQSLLSPHPGMLEFVQELGDQRPSSLARLRHLLQTLSDQGYFIESYAAEATQTAGESFVEQRGNCLSYTAMFVVLARQAGLEVNFQIVDVPPAWTAGSDYLIRRTHINALVENLRTSGAERQEVTVDFNFISNIERYDTQVVSDAYAESLYLANLAVQRLQAGDDLAGFRYLRQGLAVAPDNMDLWINLAAFYATKQAPQQAQAAYLKALELNPASRAVHAGLARTYQRLERPALAKHHQELARKYQALNPYYHFSLAQRALKEANYPRALQAINEALELKASHGGFHYLKAVTLHGLGDLAGAADSLNRAQRLGAYTDLQQRYPLSLDS